MGGGCGLLGIVSQSLGRSVGSVVDSVRLGLGLMCDKCWECMHAAHARTHRAAEDDQHVERGDGQRLVQARQRPRLLCRGMYVWV